MTNLQTVVKGFLIIILIGWSLSSLQMVSAQQFNYDYMGFQIKVDSWSLNADETILTVQGSVSQPMPFTIRLLSVSGQAVDQNMNVLAVGHIEGVPVDMPSRTLTPLTAQITSPFTASELRNMPIQIVKVSATATYCVPNWFGCLGPFQWQFTRTFSPNELGSW